MFPEASASNVMKEATSQGNVPTLAGNFLSPIPNPPEVDPNPAIGPDPEIGPDKGKNIRIEGIYTNFNEF